MKFDIFFSMSQTEHNGEMPSEQTIYKHFFEQVKLADELGMGTAWLAESHLSSEVQKENPNPVIPHFIGEVGISVDFLQVASRVFQQTKHINVGSAIMNILSNGGPIAAAEKIRAFLALHQLDENETRTLEVGFASGRFPYHNKPFGIVPRSKVEESAWWPVMTNKIFREAAEIFLRLIKGEKLSSDDIQKTTLKRDDFRTEEDWQKTLSVYGEDVAEIPISNRYQFDKLQIVPREVNLEKHLNFTIGSHNPEVQAFANTIYPCGVFNLSITSDAIVESTNERMKTEYNGNWSRDKMPRTVLVFISDNEDLSSEENIKIAKDNANFTLSEYWKALEGTLDPAKVMNAENNALIGDAKTIIAQMNERYNSKDRLMLWFDFHNHDSQNVQDNMTVFMTKVASQFN